MSKSIQPELPLITETKKRAKHLQSLLKPRLHDITLGECLNYVSKLQGERDWNVLSAKLKHAVPEQDSRIKIDDFIINTALPQIIKIASKHDMKISANASEICEGDSFGRHGLLRKIPIYIEPLGQQSSDSFCDPFLEVSMNSIRLSNNIFHTLIHFVFPNKAFSVASQFLTSDKTYGDMEPQLTRCEQQGQTNYMLSVNTSGFSDVASRGLDIFTDQTMYNYFQKELDGFLARYARVFKSFAALSGKWGNKRLVESFENALWKMNSDEPPYMAVSSNFYAKTIAGIPLYAGLGSTGPYIAGQNSSVEIGVCSIIYLEEENDKNPAGYYIAKYGDDWQVRIHLKGFKEGDIEKVTAEFGIPRGHFSETNTSFYQTPAFKGLRAWVEKHSKYAKRVSRNG